MKKKLTVFALLFALVAVFTSCFQSGLSASGAMVLSSPLQRETEGPAEIQVSAENAIVYCVNNGLTYYLKTKDNGKIFPASTTKLLTSAVALSYLSADEIVTVGEEVGFIHPLSSRAGLYYGQRIRVSELLKGLLLPSGNDAAYVLAVAAGRKISQNSDITASDALSVFISKMNSTASELGLVGTHFTCPDGIHDDDHYTSIFDMVEIAKLALANPTIAKTVSLHESSGWTNTNKLIDPDSVYYIEDAVGVKTGYTATAGNCLVAAFDSNGKEYIVCVYGCETSDERFEDAITLYEKYCA